MSNRIPPHVSGAPLIPFTSPRSETLHLVPRLLHVLKRRLVLHLILIQSRLQCARRAPRLVAVAPRRRELALAARAPLAPRLDVAARGRERVGGDSRALLGGRGLDLESGDVGVEAGLRDFEPSENGKKVFFADKLWSRQKVPLLWAVVLVESFRDTTFGFPRTDTTKWCVMKLL